MIDEEGGNNLVSVIITTHNRLTLLKKALESVFKQTFKDLEIIVVNDNSTDGTKEYLDILQKKGYIRHIFINLENSRGGNYARNIGIGAANGGFIAFLDDDDEWLPEKTKKQVSLLEANRDIGFVYCDYYTELNFQKKKLVIVDKAYIGDVSELCFQKIFCTTSMLMVRKQLLLNIGMFDESLKYWQEYDLCVRLSEKALVGKVNEPLMILRIILTDNQRLSNKYEGWIDAVNQIQKKYKARIDRLPKAVKLNHELMILREQAYRCDRCGNKKEKRIALYKIWKITKKKKHYLKYILGISKFYGK